MATIADNLYKAFAQAETGGVNDPWIRTYGVPGSSSTAYGPVQITATLARDYLKRHGDLFDEEEKDYLNKFLEQGQKFIEFGREPDKEGYDPRYDYGGSGDLVTPQDKAMYERVAKKMLMQHYRDNKGNLSSTIKEWRFGASSKKGRSADQRYWREVEETFIAPEPEEQQVAEQPTTQGSQIDPARFLESLVQLMDERRNAPQSPSEEVSGPVMQADTAQDVVNPLVQELANVLKGKRQVNEEGLERTYNEARLEAEARKAGYVPTGSDALVQALSKSEVIKSVKFDRPLPPKQEAKETEELAGGQDDSKDPIYGLF